MKRAGKVVAHIIVLAMLLNVAIYANAADSQSVSQNNTGQQIDIKNMNTLPGDIIGTQYEKAYALLSQLNILKADEDGQYYPGKDLTRAEAAAIVIRLLGLEDVSQGYGNVSFYTDVPTDSWYIGAVNYATQLKILSGYGDHTFRPDAAVKYEEFVKMLVCAIGRDIVAEAKGGYPTGYIAEASDQGILKGCAVKMGENITRGVVARYVYNTLFAELLNVSYNNGKAEYSQGNGQTTLLSQVFKLDEYEGIITANEDTGLNRASEATSKNRVKVKLSGSNSDTVFDAVYTMTKGLLGYNVKIYVKNNGSSNDVIEAIIPQDDNETITINARNVNSVTTEGSYVQVKYYDSKDSSDEETENIDLFASVIYNGKSIGSITSIEADKLLETLAPESGKLVLLDNNNDDKADVVFVTSYENYIVNGVYVSDKKITFKANAAHQRGDMDLDPNDSSNRFIIIKDGKEIGIEDIKENDVVTLVEGRDGNDVLKTLYVSDATVDGTVDELNQDSDESAIIVNGKEYILSYDINSIPALGNQCLFYVNVFGEIAYVDDSKEENNKYAFMTKASIESGVSNVLQLKIATEGNRLQVIDVKDKITFNNMSADSDQVYEMLKDKPQLIKYSTNNDGIIDKLETAGTLAPNTRYDESRFVINYDYRDSTNIGGECYFKSGTPPRIGGKYALPADCVIFDVKYDKNNAIVEDEIRASHDTKSFTNDSPYDFQVFDADRNMKAKAVVSYGLDANAGTTSALSLSSTVMLVDKILTAIGKDGDKVYKIIGLKDGKETEETFADEVDYYKFYSDPDPKMKDTLSLEDKGDAGSSILKQYIVKGAVIQYKTNIDGEIDAFRVIYTPSPDEKTMQVEGIKKEEIKIIDNAGQMSDTVAYKVYGQSGGKDISEILAPEVREYIHNYVDRDTDPKFQVANEKAFEALRTEIAGKLIKYRLDSNGEVSELTVVNSLCKILGFPTDTAGYQGAGLGSYDWEKDTNPKIELTGRIGYVVSLGDNEISITYDNTCQQFSTFVIPDNPTIYIFDKKVNKVKLGSKSDLIAGYKNPDAGSLVFARINNDDIREIVVLK